MTDLVKKNDIIIPLAALVGAPLCDKDPIASTSINKVSQMVVEACSGEQILIMPTTNSAYGVGDKKIIFCDEKSKLDQICVYQNMLKIKLKLKNI